MRADIFRSRTETFVDTYGGWNRGFIRLFKITFTVQVIAVDEYKKYYWICMPKSVSCLRRQANSKH